MINPNTQACYDKEVCMFVNIIIFRELCGHFCSIGFLKIVQNLTGDDCAMYTFLLCEK